jgi:hypothetical protein
MSTKDPTIFQIEITVEGGQLHESLSEADRELMIERLDDILSKPDTDPALRAGVIQILADNLRNNNSHEPIIIRTGLKNGDNEERLVWNCDHAKIKVKIDKYHESKSGRTPHKGREDNPFKFSRTDEGNVVQSMDYEDKDDAVLQHFYKFSVRGRDKLNKNNLELDPCIICER